MNYTPRQLRSAAEAIANARGKRRGLPPFSNIWDVLTPKLQDEVMEDAAAALDAAAGEDSPGEIALELLDALRAEKNARILEASHAAGNEAAAVAKSARERAEKLQTEMLAKAEALGL